MTSLNPGALAAPAADELPQYYHVELIVFANMDPAVTEAELWPHDIQLHYPQPLLMIGSETGGDTESSDTGTAESFKFSLKESTDRFAVPDFTLSDNTGGGVSADTAVPEPPADGDEQIIQVDDSYYRLPDTFTPLPAGQRLLEAEAGHLRRSRYKRILTHQAWVQKIPGESQAIDLLINGGQQYDQHFELEGSIRLWRERYLHIATNLWFNHFILNVGQEAGDWPLLPELPTRHGESVKAEFSVSPMLGFGNQLQTFLENQYIVDRVVLMQQRRRMRSSELHYLDHPLFGLLIEITPVELEVVVPETPPEESTLPKPASNSNSESATLNPLPTDVGTLLEQPLPREQR